MAQSWKYAFALGLVGTALTVGCVVKEGDDDAVGGESGEGGTGGSTGGSGGSGGKATGGSGGKATGGSGGKATGGSSGTGTGGTTGGSSGDAGMSGSDMGGTAGTGGTGGTDIVAECEDLEGSTPYPTCEASSATDTCGTCIEMKCCAESKACYATEPYNACGWGGPSADEFDGLYSGAGEIGCYLTCLAEYVADNDGICDDAGIDQCTAMCTSDCSLVPDAMNEMLTCVNLNCSQDCFESEAETCGD